MSVATKGLVAMWLGSVLAGGGGLYAGAPSVTAKQRTVFASSRSVELPLRFERQGEADKFLSSGAGYTVTLAANSAALGMRRADCGTRIDCRDNGAKAQIAMLSWSLVEARKRVQAEGVEQLPGRSNYLIGRDPRGWRTNVPNYAKVLFRGVYPGIDVVYYGNQGRLEYDFMLAPHADPRSIVLEFSGADRLEIDRAGNLVIQLGGQTIVQRRPFAYQVAPDGNGRPVAADYVLQGRNRVVFAVGPYDTTQPLTIDPVLVYSTYFGGSNADQATGTAIEYSTGKTYLTGVTLSPNLPTNNGLSSTLRGASDIFVTKLNAAGTAIEYSTYIGGDGNDEALGLALDEAGNAYITGATDSANFPTTGGSFRTGPAGQRDAFALKLNPSGNGLVYSTYLGGSNADDGYGVALDLNNIAYIAGITDSDNFPTTAGAFQSSRNGGSDAFITRLNADGSALTYSSYLGGAATDWAFGLGTDVTGNAYLAGLTSSANFPTTSGVVQTTLSGGSDGFIVKVNPAENGAASLKFSTFLGGSGIDWAFSIAVDSIGHAYASGLTNSTNFPTSGGALQTVKRGSSDAFIAKLSQDGSALDYATYLGGDGADYARSLATDSSGQVFVSGSTESLNFPTATGATQTASGGRTDAFMVKVDSAGSGLLTATYLGGNQDEEGFAVAQSAASSAAVVGVTNSNNFPTVSPLQAAPDGSSDAFVRKFADTAATNPSESARFFVRQQYLDFLNRDPDAAGLDFWVDNIIKCSDPARRPPGQTEALCLLRQRETTSAAFFLSPEFQYTGYYVYRMYQGALGRQPKLAEFLPDAQFVGAGIVVNGQLSGAKINQNKADFARQFVNCTDANKSRCAAFKAIYDGLNNVQYVDKLFQTTGVNASASDRTALVNELNTNPTTGRGSVLQKVVDGINVISEGNQQFTTSYGQAFYNAEFNRAFVEMEYFGYLKRDPDDAGYAFWLGKLNQYGSFVDAEMVLAFILSPEYRTRFGEP